MRAQRRRVCLDAVLCFMLLACARPSFAREPAKLIVLVVIDQFGTTYVDRYATVFQGGLERLRRRGALLANVAYVNANTETAPGHGTIVTGAWPNVHGMVANYWFDPDTMRRVNCVEDPNFGRSPRNLMAPGIADALRLATRGRAKVISVGIKDRSTIILGGERPNAAIWYNQDSGRFISGSWYRAREQGGGVDPDPAWVTDELAKHGAEFAFGSTWSPLLPGLDYASVAGADDDLAETNLPGVGRTFPHALGSGLSASSLEWKHGFLATPGGIDSVFAIAERAFVEEQLGRRDTTDMLALAVSTLDYTGHYYGPDSQEALDVVLRIDRALDRLIDRVDRALGPKHALWIVTADHGIAPAPEHARAYGARASRIDQGVIAVSINEALAKLAGKPGPVPAVEDLNAPRVYLRFPAEPRFDRLAFRREAARVLRSRPEIVDARAVEDVKELSQPWRELVERILYAGRDPDVVFIQRPYDIIEPGVGQGGTGTGSAHGTPYTYDALVPVIAAGPRVIPREHRTKYEMTRLAPAIAALLGIAPPAAAFDQPLPIVENQ